MISAMTSVESAPGIVCAVYHLHVSFTSLKPISFNKSIEAQNTLSGRDNKQVWGLMCLLAVHQLQCRGSLLLPLVGGLLLSYFYRTVYLYKNGFGIKKHTKVDMPWKPPTHPTKASCPIKMELLVLTFKLMYLCWTELFEIELLICIKWIWH